MQTLKKQKSSPLKYRNEPSRFFGDGAVFKAKLIGILEVGEARGDRMCQEALQDLKMAIRAAGEHKQKITIHVTIDGLRLRDEKTGDSLYHHPVHKISFIAQDMTDSRAFGYIFGSPDSGHRFFGIKTDKAASQVVLAMRDLFQVVFELKKKEIELARQHIQNKITQHEHQVAIAALTNKSSNNTETSNFGTKNERETGAHASNVSKSDKSPVSVADLVDLEQELSSIQRGITQMDSQERIMDRLTSSQSQNQSQSENTPKNSVTDKDDPFGDSFTSVPTYNLLPPPESSKRHQKPQKQEQQQESLAELAEVLSKFQAPLATTDDWLNTPPQSATEMHESVSFGEDLAGKMTEQENDGPASAGSDVFTELDPLGTGKIKPYVDKKYFFQELKNPPKKILRELSSGGTENIQFDASFANRDQKLTLTDIQRLESDLMSGGMTQTSNANTFDPFKDVNVDLFADDPFATDPFETSGSPANINEQERRKSTSPGGEKLGEKSREEKQASPNAFINGPLQVNLPPENWSSGTVDRKSSESPQPSNIARNRPTAMRQNTIDAISSLSSKKMIKPPTIFSHSKFGKRGGDSNGINMKRLQESDSMSENELPHNKSENDRPEPPPRPDTGAFIEPPPLPPKKQFSDIVIRPNSNTSNSSGGSRSVETTRYDYLSGKKLTSSDDTAPPLPLPSRRLGKSDTSFPGPQRPQKKMEDDYLTPITSTDIPTLLPPPQKKDPSKMTRGPRRSDYESSSQIKDTSPNLMESQPPDPAITEMTLTNLLSLGIKDMAKKLNVPESKLSTMTLIELTSYLSKFLENSKQQQTSSTPPVVATFKVNFDQPMQLAQDDTFFAKFDDNFGEDDKFEPDFDKLNNLKPNTPPPSADRYAAFREIIIEQEIVQPSVSPTIQFEEERKSSITGEKQDGRLSTSLDFEKAVEAQINRLSPNMQIGSVEMAPPPPPIAKIDTKITEKIANAKDRYAALRDIILVEDLFEKPSVPLTSSSNSEEKEEDLFESFDESKITHQQQDEINQTDDREQISPEINISAAIGITDAPPDPEMLSSDSNQNNNNNLSTTNMSNRDDIEIDEYMNRAISNLSINSRGNLSPAVSATSKSPTTKMAQSANASTSPMRIQNNGSSKSPCGGIEQSMSSLSVHVNDMSTSPIPIQKTPDPLPPVKQEGSCSDVSPEVVNDKEERSTPASICPGKPEEEPSSAKSNENWASFDQSPSDKNTLGTKDSKKPKPRKPTRDSPYSSDDKNADVDQFDRKHPHRPKPSSRDLSPWEEDAEYRRRGDRYAPPRHSRGRIDSCDEDYEYDAGGEYEGPRRRTKGSHPWSPPSDRDRYERPMYGPWSPEDEQRRNFERNAYERSTYGPPHQPKSLNTYDRRVAYEKQKYFRDRGRMDFPFDDPYEDMYESGYRGKRNDYENVYDEKARSREYFYSKEKRSFESNDSFDSRGRYGSGEIYGYSDYRDRYLERGRLLKGRNAQSKPDLEQDSDTEMSGGSRRSGFEGGSLSRPRPKPMQIDDEIWGAKPGGAWRPGSANEPERRRMMAGGSLVGSDGEKERRFRRKLRGAKSEHADYASTYATMRYPIRTRRDEYYDYDPEQVGEDPYYARQRQQYYKSTTPRSENRSMDRSLEKHRYDYEDEMEDYPRRNFVKKSSSRDLFYEDKDVESFDDDKTKAKQPQKRFEFTDFEEPQPPKSSGTPGTKFNFDDGGFESDFNSPPVPGSGGSSNHNNQKAFRFSNDYSDKDSPKQQKTSLRANYETTQVEFSSPHSNTSHTSTTMKLRFNENVKVSQFDASNSNMFEDDFSKASVETSDIPSGDQWSSSEMPLKKGGNDMKSKTQQHENIKKSESVNIFAKKKDFDPFEDDPFFGGQQTTTSNNNNGSSSSNNKNNGENQSFANFDANM